MAFSRAKVKRFNEITSCAPPPGHYDPKLLDKVQGPLLNSKDERFKDPKETPGPNLGLSVLDKPERLRSSSVSSSHSGRLGSSSPAKFSVSAAPSIESLSSLQSEPVSGIPRKSGIPVCKIMPPADYARFKELEKRHRLIVEERNALHKNLQMKSEDFLKLDFRLQICMKEKAELESTVAKLEKEREGANLEIKASRNSLGLNSSKPSSTNGLKESDDPCDDVFSNGGKNTRKADINGLNDGGDDELNNLQKSNELLKIEIENLKSNYEAKLQELDKEKTNLLEQLNSAQKGVVIDCQKCLQLSSMLDKMRSEISALLISNVDKDEKFNSLESELRVLSEECNKYKSLLNDSVESCNKLSTQLNDLQKQVGQMESDKEINLNLILNLENDLKENVSKYENLVTATENEKQKLNKLIEELQQKPFELNNEIESLKTELENANLKFENQANDLNKTQTKLNSISDEASRFKEIIDTLQQQTDSLKDENKKITDELTGINNLKTHFEDLHNQKVTELQNSVEQITDLTHQIDIKNTQITELNTKMEHLEDQFNKLEHNYNEQIADKALVEQEKIKFYNEIQTLGELKDSLEMELRELKRGNEEKEKTISKMDEGYKEKLSDLNNQMESLNGKYKENLLLLEESETNITSLNVELTNLKDEIVEIRTSFEQEKAGYVDQIKNHEIKFEQLTEENVYLLKDLTETKTILNETQTQFQTTESQYLLNIENLEDEILEKSKTFETKLTSKILTWSNKCSELNEKIKSSETQVSEMEEKLKVTSSELNEQIERLKQVYDANTEEKSKLENELLAKDSTIKKLSEEKAKLDEDIQYKVEQLNLARDEKDRLQDICSANKVLITNLNEVIAKAKQSEVDLKKTNTDLIDQMNEAREMFDFKIFDMQKNIDDLNISIDTKEMKINDLRTDLETKSQKIFELELEMEKVKKERLEWEELILDRNQSINKLHSVIVDKEKIISDLETLNIEKETKIKDMESQVMVRDKDIINLEDLCSSKDNEIIKIENTLRENNLKFTEIEQEHQSKLAELKELHDDLTACKVKLSDNEDLLKMKSEQFERLKSEMGVIENQLKATEEINLKTKSNLEKECSDLLKQLDRREEKLAEVTIELRTKDSELQRISSDMQLKENELKKEINDLTMLNKKLSKEKNWLQLKNDEMSTELNNNQMAFKHDLDKQLSEQKVKYVEKMRDYELLVEKMNLLQDQSERWKFMYEDLAAKVEPFKDQLEQFELEKQALLSRNKNAQMEVDKLSKEYAKMIGHQNHKQKIHHMVKIKEENLALKSEIENLRAKEMMNRKRIEKLTEKLDALEGRRRYDPAMAFKNSTGENYGENPDGASETKVRATYGGRMNSVNSIAGRQQANDNKDGGFSTFSNVAATGPNVAKENDGRKFSLAYPRGGQAQADASDVRKYSISTSSSSSSASSRTYLKEGNR